MNKTLVLSNHSTIQNALENNVVLCQNYVQSLFEVSCERSDILQWFQGLCRELTKIIGLIRCHHKEIKEESKNFKSTPTLLYLTQVVTSLSLLIRTFVREEEIKIILETRKCVLKQMTCCLESILIALDRDTLLFDPSGNFVRWMDSALEKIAEINIHENKTKAVDKYRQSRQDFEEVLSHAMSIAQVSLPEDSKIIRGSCQTVLSTLSSLEMHLNSTIINDAMINLFIDACSDKLCVLEKKVNTAVLKLCLRTFSQFTLPLEKIHNFCFNALNKRKQDELDSLIADFDLHVDRIMQIGLFAVSCSSDFQRGIKIRSCLASLEALESELVPALNAVLLDNSEHNINCATILMNHWLDQANCLQQLIYLIIDPFAFCQVVYEEASQIVHDLSKTVEKRKMIRQHDIHGLLYSTNVLRSFLENAQSEFSADEADKIKTRKKEYYEVLEEVEKASEALLSTNNNDIENCKRVLKRCKILLTVLKRVWLCFVDVTLPQRNSNMENHGLPSKFENLQMATTGNLLDHIINRGKQILRDRSVLYRTPIKNIPNKTKSSELIKHAQKQIPLSKLVHLRKHSFMNVTDKNETTIDLQVTDILNEMTNLSATFGLQEGPYQWKTNTQTIQETGKQF